MSTTPVVLLTGFEPFSGQPFNASAEGVRMFCEAGELGERADVSWRVLPVVYDEAALRLEDAIDELKLKRGQSALAIIKSTEVMIAREAE